jgi:type II secretory pathway component PulC
MPDQDELEYTPRPVVPALGEIPLSREWIEDQLLQQAELEMHFEAAEHEVEGVRLTKLTGVEQSEFYQTLGFQQGDVLMRVNDQWVHEAQNDLFDALSKEKRISVVLVRKGLPVHLMYSIQD